MAGSLTAGKLLAVSDLSRTRRYGVLLAGMLLAVFAVEPLGWQHVGQQLIQKAGADGVQKTVLVILPVVMGLLIGAGFAAGLFLIPLNAALQAESDPNKLGKTIAVQNFCDNLGMVIAGLLVFICVKVNLSASQVFLVLAVMVAAALGWLKFPAQVKDREKSAEN